MINIILWGTGERTLDFIQKGLFKNCNILAIADTYSEKSEYMGYKVIKPEMLSQYPGYDYVVINNQYYFEVMIMLARLNVPTDKIVITDNVIEKPFCECYRKTKTLFPEIFDLTNYAIKRSVKANERDFEDKNSIYSRREFGNMEYRHDYYRYRTAEFAAEMIGEYNVEGAIAELGVFRGLFSAVLNYRFPNRKIYLFDTFEGFSPEEAQKEISMGRCGESFIEDHKDTSVEIMLQNLPNPDNAVVCKGLFPDTVTEEAANEKYAFVSLDVDFEESTLEGLKFFYPRLSEGGYIFIHDYNTFYLDGIKTAVKRYEEIIDRKLHAVPIADRAGTLIITK